MPCHKTTGVSAALETVNKAANKARKLEKYSVLPASILNFHPEVQNVRSHDFVGESISGSVILSAGSLIYCFIQ